MSLVGALSDKPWWSVPENFLQPLEFCMDKETEEQIFGTGSSDTLLRRIEEHSGILIHLEPWFTASGQTRVIIVGPIPARRWLLKMIRCLESFDSEIRAQGFYMLLRVRSHPLTEDNLYSLPGLLSLSSEMALSGKTGSLSYFGII
ncbi:PREDICTED: KH homology domain-containing protein 1-like [Elephantulus edwardii]|uniref:KH homology domain-containing protein 1-like n=1 Tax=Elephantulus edwardii TaxID=28737 RepID=UPI0003F0D187|nr:PREDICTED: KH homology domain-containing protein 1-like [Elephantulus edwardii]